MVASRDARVIECYDSRTGGNAHGHVAAAAEFSPSLTCAAVLSVLLGDMARPLGWMGASIGSCGNASDCDCDSGPGGPEWLIRLEECAQAPSDAESGDYILWHAQRFLAWQSTASLPPANFRQENQYRRTAMENIGMNDYLAEKCPDQATVNRCHDIVTVIHDTLKVFYERLGIIWAQHMCFWYRRCSVP
jgi:hypothetical protein